jgi:lipopolysaccharide exporter
MSSIPTGSIGRSIAAGAAWMISLRVADRMIGLVSLAILARLLLPEDFGLVALALSLIALVDMFGDFGVELQLIQNQRAERHHYDSAWTLNIIVAVIAAVILFLLAAPAAQFFAEPRAAAIIRWLALAGVISALANIGVVNFRKHLQFDREFRYLLNVRVTGTLSTLLLAYLWHDYWALVAGTLAQAAVRVALSYALNDYRPRFSLAALSEIFHFSKWVLAQNVTHGLNDRAPQLVIGKLANASALAHFSVAYEISNLATSELAAPIRRALFPGFAKMAADLAILREGFVKTFAVMTTIALPIPLGIALTAPLIVPVFLGERWLAAIPLIQVLALYGAVRTLSTSSHVVYLALGRPRITAQLSTLRLAVLAPLLIWGTMRSGALGAAWALVAASLLVWLVDFAILFRVLRFGRGDLVRAVWRTLVAAFAMVVGVLLLQVSFPAPGTLTNFLSQLLANAAIGAAIYCTALFALWRLSDRPNGAESMILAALRDTFARRRQRA